MADITGNPTPLNVPAPQDASGRLTPLQGAAAQLLPVTPPPAEPVGVNAPLTLPSTPNVVVAPAEPVGVPGPDGFMTTTPKTPPPAVPDLT